MKNETDSFEQLTEIRNLMERSSRFISLSGMSGVASGLIALTGWCVAIWGTGIDNTFNPQGTWLLTVKTGTGNGPVYLIALLVLIAAISASIYFTVRNSVKKGIRVWDNTARRLILTMSFPLLTGGLFCLILIRVHQPYLIIPASLIFYGLALAGASRYTLHEIRVLGILQVALGLLAGFIPELALLLWAVGFGALHILYGGLMFKKYEAPKGNAS